MACSITSARTLDQTPEDSLIYLILANCRLILFEAQALQPTSDINGGALVSPTPDQPTWRSWPAQNFARSTFLSTLPTGVMGKESTNSIRLGAWAAPFFAFTS
jgi:hypothetical protein